MESLTFSRRGSSQQAQNKSQISRSSFSPRLVVYFLRKSQSGWDSKSPAALIVFENRPIRIG
ncbi:MAG: hypothetical protein QOH41_337 [Blastocatellia bacterium]|jgi:hypothetical protein|nr:hypothetical protein [Blastocatellia bacterium]